MSEALTSPEDSRASLATPPVELAPDPSGREFLTEEEVLALITEIQAGVDARKLLASDSVPDKRSELEVIVQKSNTAEMALFEDYDGYISKIARAYYGIAHNDLLQHAKVGFLLAARQYQGELKHGEFRSYAGWLIRREIKKTIVRTSRSIRLPEEAFWLAQNIPVAERDFTHEYGRLPTNDELAKILKKTSNMITDVRTVINDATSLDAPLGDDDLTWTVGDTVGVYDRASDEEARGEQPISPQILSMINSLPAVQRDVIVRRLGIGDYPEMTAQEIADELGKARSGVHHAGQRAMRNLHAVMSGMGSERGIGESGESEVEDTIDVREKGEYDPFASPLLDIRDGSWLISLMGKSPSTEFFHSMNELIMAGSDDLSLPNASNLSERELVERNLSARAHFFENLGWMEEKHPLHESYKVILNDRRRLPSLARFVFAQRALKMYQVNPEFLLTAIPGSAFYSAESIMPTLEAYKAIGLKPDWLIKTRPGLLRRRAEGPGAITDIADVLVGEGMNAPLILTRAPELLERTPQELRDHIAGYRERGFDPARIAKHSAKALNLPPLLLDGKMASMEEMGLDSHRLISKCPGLATYNTEVLRSKLSELEDLGYGVKWVDLINKNPVLLTLAVTTLDRRGHLIKRFAQALQWQGDVDVLLSTHPEILTTADTKLSLLAHIAAEHLGDDARNTPASQIAGAIWVPVGAHMLAASREGRPYSTAYADHYRRGMSSSTREQSLVRTFQDPEAVKRIGSKVVRAYNRHTSLKK